MAFGVPAKRLGIVFYGRDLTNPQTLRCGTITGAKDGRLLIRLDGDKRPGLFHPTADLHYI